MSTDVAFWTDIIALQHRLVTNASWLLANAERMAGREPSARLAAHIEQCRTQLVETRATLERHIVKAYEAGWRPEPVTERSQGQEVPRADNPNYAATAVERTDMSGVTDRG